MVYIRNIYICANATRKVLGKVPKECTRVDTKKIPHILGKLLFI